MIGLARMAWDLAVDRAGLTRKWLPFGECYDDMGHLHLYNPRPRHDGAFEVGNDASAEYYAIIDRISRGEAP